MDPLFSENYLTHMNFLAGVKKSLENVPNVLDGVFRDYYPRPHFKGTLKAEKYSKKYLYTLVDPSRLKDKPDTLADLEKSVHGYKVIVFLDPSNQIVSTKKTVYSPKSTPVLIAFEIPSGAKFVNEVFDEKAEKKAFPKDNIVRVMLKREYHAFVYHHPEKLKIAKVYSLEKSTGELSELAKDAKFTEVYKDGFDKLPVESLNNIIVKL